jgi:hypothetical protein
VTFAKVKDLTVTEALALAFVEYRQNRFTSSKLATYLCNFLCEPFQPGKISTVDQLLQIALAEKLVQPAPGPRGGAGFQISALGSAHVSDVDLPSEKFKRRDELDQERELEASANIGPVFEELLELLDVERAAYRERKFVQDLAHHWLDHGWLSRKQVNVLAETAAKHGLYVESVRYIGSSMNEWRQPYIDAALRQQAESRARAKAAASAREEEWKAREHAKALLRDANKLVKDKLNAMMNSGRLSGLDALVTEVFPGTALSASAKANAFAGRGSHAMRICAAAMAFGKPPSHVWKSDGSFRQLGDESDEWQLLVSHPAFLALGLSLDSKV